MFPTRVPMDRDSLSPEPVVHSFIHSFIHVYLPESPKRSPLTYTEKHKVHGAPRRQKAYIQWGAAWFPKGIVNDTAVSTPVPSSPRHNTFHLGLGRPEPCSPVCVVATPITVYPPQLLPPPKWHGRVEYESMIPQDTDEGLGLLEAK